MHDHTSTYCVRQVYSPTVPAYFRYASHHHSAEKIQLLLRTIHTYMAPASQDCDWCPSRIIQAMRSGRQSLLLLCPRTSILPRFCSPRGDIIALDGYVYGMQVIHVGKSDIEHAKGIVWNLVPHFSALPCSSRSGTLSQLLMLYSSSFTSNTEFFIITT